MPMWQMENDLVSFASLRFRIHRIGLSHWNPGVRARSWGVAPLYFDGHALLVPCHTTEGLWFGAWMDDDSSAQLRLSDKDQLTSTTMFVPREFQITGLRDSDGGEHPLTRMDAWKNRELELDLQCGRATTVIHLVLSAPDSWAALAGRPAPVPVTVPPALPPRLG